MTMLASWGFSYPWVILCAPLPWVAYYLLRPLAPYQAVVAPSLFTLLQRWQAEKQTSSLPQCLLNNLSFLLLWGLLLLSAACPYYVTIKTPLKNDYHHLLLALDISDSMSTKDVVLAHGQVISRLEAARQFLQQLIYHFPNDKIGLILFGSLPYLVIPLTHDHASIREFLQHSKTGMAGSRTAIGDTLALGINRFNHVKKENKASHTLQQTLILLTDGENTAGTFSPVDAATYAAESRVRIYTLGAGSQTKQSDELDDITLKYIAQKTSAIYVHIEHPHAIKKLITALEQQQKNNTPAPSYQVYHSLIAWPLSIAFILSIPWLNQYTRGRKQC